MNTIHKNLKALREGMRISQAKLAAELGTTQTTINRYETGKTTPPADTLLWYADRFDVSLDYIFGRTDKPQGKLYKYQPKPGASSAEMEKFIEMCFDPKSPAHERLKQTLIKLIQENNEEK